MSWVDYAISNHRGGLCMCGRGDGVEYGPSPFGYGNVCIACQREWSRMHGGARWQSERERTALKKAVKARLLAEGINEQEAIRRWNRDEPPYPARPIKTDSKLSDKWKAEYEAAAEQFERELA